MIKATMKGTVRVDGTEHNPFGLELDDPRLAASGFIASNEKVLFGFLTTNTKIFISKAS